MPTRQEMEARARQMAAERGLDPDFWAKVIEGESGWNPAARARTAREDSGGLLQLNTKRGVGVEALKAGINPHDPTQWEQTARLRVRLGEEARAPRLDGGAPAQGREARLAFPSTASRAVRSPRRPQAAAAQPTAAAPGPTSPLPDVAAPDRGILSAALIKVTADAAKEKEQQRMAQVAEATAPPPPQPAPAPAPMAPPPMPVDYAGLLLPRIKRGLLADDYSSGLLGAG